MEPMRYFTDFFEKIDNNIVRFTSDHAQAVISIIEPAVVTGMSIYLLFYGYRHMKGEIEQPFMAFIDNMVKMAVVVGTALNFSNYNTYIIDTFTNSPVALAAAFGMDGGGTLSGNMGTLLDTAVGNSFDIGMSFMGSGIGYGFGGVLIGVLVWIVGLAVTMYTAALVGMAKILGGVVLSLGPLFIAALMFDKTKGFFGNFLNTVLNSGLVLVLTFATSSFILSLFWHAVTDIAALGTTANAASSFSMFITGGLGLLVLRQVTSLASSLAGGVSMDSFGIGRHAANLTRRGGGAAYRAAGGERRERAKRNQRSAEDQHDVKQRHDKLVARVEAKKRRGGSISDGTNG